MISKEQFERIEMNHGCGYWNVCDDHACPCSPTAAVSRGFSEAVYERMAEARREETDRFHDSCGVPGCSYKVRGKCSCIGFCALDDED